MGKLKILSTILFVMNLVLVGLLFKSSEEALAHSQSMYEIVKDLTTNAYAFGCTQQGVEFQKCRKMGMFYTSGLFR